MARRTLMSRTTVLLALLALAAPAAAGAQDSDAPAGAEAHWLPDEEWVNRQWLPYDEERLYRLLGRTRGEIFRHVRIDADHTLAQLGRRRGYSPDRLATALVAPRRGKVSESTWRLLRRHARRTLTQGHLSQHLLFHSLHQTTIPERARQIFGVRRVQDFLLLRRAEISPLQIGELYGRTRVAMNRRAQGALRDAAAAGVRRGELTRRQARAQLDRQLRQVPRWLGQSRYNGPSGGRNRPKLPPGDQAKRPSITAGGGRVVWDAYRTRIPDAERRGEIHVKGTVLGRSGPFAVSPAVRPGSRRPHSAYNSVVSADGGATAFETAASTFPLAKRVGQMSVLVRDTATGRTEKVSHLGRPAGSPTRSAFNPTLSADGRLVAFEATDTAKGGGASRNGLWLVDRATNQARLLAEHDGTGAAFLPRLAGDGSAVAYTAVDGRGVTQVYVRSLADGAVRLVSRADGEDGAPASIDAYEPAISRDGSVVAFASRAGGLGGSGRGSHVYVRDLKAGTTRLMSAGARGDAIEPAISADASRVAFVVRRRQRRVTATNLRSSLWVRDRGSGAATLVSRAGGPDGAAAGGYSSQAALSADGGRIVFSSSAGNLAGGKPRGLSGIFVRDLAAQSTTLLSDHRQGSRTRSARAAGAGDGVRHLPGRALCPLGL